MARRKIGATIALDGELVDVRDFVCEAIPRAVKFAAVNIKEGSECQCEKCMQA